MRKHSAILHISWCKEVGLSLNPSRTVIVPFTNRYKLHKMKAITLSECRKEASN